MRCTKFSLYTGSLLRKRWWIFNYMHDWSAWPQTYPPQKQGFFHKFDNAFLRETNGFHKPWARGVRQGGVEVSWLSHWTHHCHAAKKITPKFQGNGPPQKKQAAFNSKTNILIQDPKLPKTLKFPAGRTLEVPFFKRNINLKENVLQNLSMSKSFQKNMSCF